MPLVFSSLSQLVAGASAGPYTTPSTAKGVLIINSSPANLTFTAGTLGSIPVIAYSSAVLAVNPNDGLSFTVDAVGATNPGFAQTFVDLNYLLSNVTPSFQGLPSTQTLPVGTDGGSPAVQAAIVSNVPQKGTLSDASGTVAIAGTSQLGLAAGSAKQYLLVQNMSTTGGQNLYLNWGNAAAETAGSVMLQPGGALVFEADFLPSEVLNVTSNTTGLPFTIKYA